MTEISDEPVWRVVIADDDADIRVLVGIAVRRAGLDLVGDAADGDEAWEAVTSTKPDLVVLDVAMPGASGIEVCQRIRSEPSLEGTRILMLSAAVSEGSQLTAYAAGADGFIIKPFSPRALAVQLADAVSLGKSTL